MNGCVHHFLENSASRRPDKVALVHDGERVTYRRLDRAASRLAAFFIERGVLPGDRIVLLLGNGVHYVASYYGILKAGAVAVPLNLQTGPEALARLCEELQPAGIVMEREGALLRTPPLFLPSVRFVLFADAAAPAGEGGGGDGIRP